MKLYRLFFLMILFLATVSCEKDDISTIAPDGQFVANFDFPKDEIFAPAKVFLLNRTKNADKYEWKFEGGKLLKENGEVMDTSATTGVVPDTIVYDLPGTYQITLTAHQGDKVETVTKQLVIKKMQPRINVPENILYQQEVEFSATVFQYPGKDVTYSWDFGNGVTSTEASPKITFTDAGTYTVTLTINDGQETLTTSAEVVVKGELVKTLYFTDALTGKLYKYRFTQVQQSNPKQLPVSVGLHPLSINVSNNKVIISDAGANLAYSAWGTPADGKVFAVDLEGKNPYIITQPVPKPAGTAQYGDDPFVSTVDANGNVYWVSRFSGVRSLPASAMDAIYPAVKFGVTAADIGVSSTYGWTDGAIQVIDNTIWYSKHGTGKGLYKYTLAGQYIEAIPGLSELKIRSFAVDQVNSKIYFAISVTGGGYNKGLYVSDLNGSNIQLIDDTAGFSDEGGASENTYITSIMIDNTPDDGSAGYVYYSFRSNTDVSSTGAITGDGSNSGVKRYPLNGGSAEFFLRGFIPYGLSIDPVKR
ncbi:PKD domain-containing protein [Pontibacter sp. MBLB2868]|uniref:PKD domain-containing protein n=1 Tax=Pontibacter sp. MBLB2868 TaxID=3451555 RepID=UPI003F7536ED